MSRPYGFAKWRELFPIYNSYEDKDLPWIKTWIRIENRCKGDKKYTRYGIKNLITPIELHYLWICNKAFNMKQPSIDRIDGRGHYTLSNCRFIEHLENSKKRDYTSKEYRLKHSIKMKNSWEEGKFSMVSSLTKRRWNNPKMRKQITEKLSLRSKELWKDSTYRETQKISKKKEGVK